ncbi:MAG TPA: hypothetical protein DEF64_05225 [Ruminococcaceae bacterium]|nr:hypothetical protein [Oscillospiraceae bacterium]
MKQQLFTTGDAVSTECAVNTKRRGRLLAMAAGILSVLILLVTAMQFVISAGADRYSGYSDDCRKFMMDYMKESSSYDTLVNKTYMPYRNYVETLGRDTAFQAEMKAWELATLDLKSAAIQVTNSKEYKYHLGILMDILSDTTQNSDFISSLKNMADACHVSTTKAALKFGKEYNNLNMKLNPQDAKKIAAELSDINTISSYMSVAGDISDLIEQSKNLDDLLNKLSQAQVIYDLTVGYADMMQDMYNRCDSDNTALKAALLTMRDLCNQSMSKVDMVALFAGSTVAEEAMKIALGEVQKEIVSAMGLTGTAITLAQSVGKMYANILFGTENIQAAYYELNALYNIENLIRESLANTTDADSFFAAFTLYEHVTYKAADYSTKYEEALYTDNIVGKLFAWVTGKDKQLEEYKKSIENCKGLVKLSFDTLQFSAYNAFIESKYTSDVSSYFTVTDKYTLPSEETITQNDENIELLSLQTCGLPDESYTLDDDLTILNNLYHSSGTIDLNGHTLTINGDLILESGSIDVNGGELIIMGNYDAYVPVENDDGTTSYTGGYLYMNNANDKVTVDGDFNTYVDYYYHSDYYHRFCNLNLGLIEIKGNLNDHCKDYSIERGLYSKGTKFIFSGTAKQTITADDGYIYFENVEFVNKDTTGSIEFDSTEISCHIEKDETVTGNLEIRNMNLYGHKLTVNGNLQLWNSLSPDGGELYITGDYNAYKATTNKDGTVTYISGGRLGMCKPNDKVTIEGDFNTCSDDYYYIDGVIEIKGNLNSYSKLYSSGTKFIFSSTGKQIITSTSDIEFANIEFENKDTTGSIEFNNTKISCYIEKDQTVNGNLCIEDMNLNGHKLTVNGDLKLWNRLSLGGGELYITGNYDAYIPVKNANGTTSYTGGYLYTSKVNDKVTVDGNFETNYDYEGSGNLVYGAIEIKGNLNDYYNYSSSSGGLYSRGTKFIFSGTGTQTITVLDGALVLKTAEFVNKDVQIACSTDIDVDVPVRVHDYSDEWTVDVEAACKDGSKSHHCTRCDAKTDITVIPATGKHSFGDWKITKVATCTAEGTQTRTCSVCGTVETQTIEALGHTEVTDKAVAATCTKTGLTEGKHCSVCNTVIKAQEVVPATGKHSFGNWKITKAATCTVTGTKTRTCSGCGKVETQTIAKMAHKYANTVVKPTYTAQGYTLHKCSVCGTSYKDTYTAKLTLAKVTGVKLGGRAADALRVNWSKNASADGYIVEMYQGNKWVRVAKIISNATTTYRASGLKASSVYKFRVRAYKMEGKAVAYGAYSTELAVRTNPSVMTGAKLSGRAADALRINWTKNASADGYIIEMYQGGKWVRVAKITSNNTTTFRKAGLSTSSAYKFRVRAYKMSGSTALYGNYSATVTARTNPSIVKGVKISGKAKDALRVNWTKNASAQGYIVEMYKGGKWVRVAKITNGNTTTFRKAGLAKNTAYKFRVCAYYMSGKTALYGNYGSVSGKTAAK